MRVSLPATVCWGPGVRRCGLGSERGSRRPKASDAPRSGGRDDKRGSGNHMKPETVLRAARLIKTGEVFELGRVLPKGCRFRRDDGSRFSPSARANDPGTNRRGSNEELVVSEIGQVGTQFDTFSHQMIGSQHVQLLHAGADGQPHRLQQARRVSRSARS